jgi:hypothetical protein
MKFFSQDYIRANANSNNFNHLLRARIDHYHRLQTDLDTVCLPMNSLSLCLSTFHLRWKWTRHSELIPMRNFLRSLLATIHIDSSSPCNVSICELRFYPLRISLFRNNSYDSKPAMRYPQPLPAAMSNRSEHLIELPSDIFLASRAGEYEHCPLIQCAVTR